MSDSTTESVRDTLSAAFEAAERAAPPPPRAPASPRPDVASRDDTTGTRLAGESRESVADNTPADTPEPSPEPTEQRSGIRPRDQFGRFLSATPEGPKATEPGEPTEQPIPDHQPEPPAGEPDDSPAIAPPSSWSSAARTSWDQLPRAIQEEVDRREREVSNALRQRAEQANVLEPMAQALAPYQQKLSLRGIHPAQAVNQLLAVQDLLERDPVEGVAYVARQYGVDLRTYAAAYQQAQQPVDPAQREQMDRIGRLEQMLHGWSQSAQQQEQARIQSEVAIFAADTTAHPHFEAVRPQMAQLMANNMAMSLDEAYRQACRLNDGVWQQMQQEQARSAASQRARADREAADRARRAAVSVSGAPAGNGSTRAQATGGKAGSVRSDLEQVVAAAFQQ